MVSTKETDETRAEGIAALKFAAVVEDGDPLKGKPPTRRDVEEILRVRCAGRTMGWVWQSRYQGTARKYQHHEMEVAREVLNARHIRRHTAENDDRASA